MSVFDKAFELIIGVEGGYSNDPKDPGGETKYGITKRDHPDVDIANLTLEQAKEIYRKEYWAPARCEDMSSDALSIFMFDCAINQGVSVALKTLQKALGTVQDGVIGNNTLAALRRADQKELCAMFMADRALRYTGTRNFDLYGRGWLKRLFVIVMGV